MPFGYHGRYLRINANTGMTAIIPLEESVLRATLGGVGLAAWITTQECPPGVEPFAPENPLVICFSPLVGTPLTTSAKFAVASKSPLTNRFCDALSSSHFALNGKRTGFDAIVISGQCATASVILVDEDKVRIESAETVWGRVIPEANAALISRYGSGYRFGVIGPAGENGVRYATLSFDGRHAGRGGLGAVLGAKNIKAIGVAGNCRASLADTPVVLAAAKALSAKSFGPATAKYRELGTVANLLTLNRLNALPTRNFTAGQFEGAEALGVEQLAATRAKMRSSCAACTIGCEHAFTPAGGKPVRLEYESLFALGSLCGISDADSVLNATSLCDDLGLDTISTGATLAFAMECAERGLLQEPDLRFGRGDKLLALLPQIAHKNTTLGKLLAEGSKRAAERIGGVAPSFAPHVKGLELPGYEPRALQSMALGFAVGTRGADHNRSGAYEADLSSHTNRLHGDDRSVALAIEAEDKAALMDSLILCKFLRGVFTDVFAESAELMRGVTGWNITAEELRTTAKAIVKIKWAFNVREGWTPKEDTLPDRFLSEGLPEGTAPGSALPRERLLAMVESYYRQRGWA